MSAAIITPSVIIMRFMHQQRELGAASTPETNIALALVLLVLLVLVALSLSLTATTHKDK